MIPNELKAKPGDNILEKFKKLVSYIDGQKLVSVDERVQIEETGNGTNVMLLSKGENLTYDHPLKIRLIGDDTYRVDEGYVNHELPYIRTKGVKGKILHKIDSEEGVGIIPNNLQSKDYLWLFSCTYLTNRVNGTVTAYIECMNTELLEKQQANITELHLGKSHIPRPIDDFQFDYEYYIPMAFMRQDKVIHNFCWHNIVVRPYKIGITNRIIFWPS